MNLQEGIITRRSIRKYKNTTICDNDLEHIIKCGMHAPSAVNKQPWHFVIFRSNKVIKQLIEVHPNAGMLRSAAAGILICYDTKLQHDDGFGPVDCAAATQNMLLAAHGLNLGACWIGIYPRQQRMNKLQEAFNLPEHVIPFSVISVGHPDEVKKQPERFKKERIHYEGWNH